jgi:N-acetylglucosaminyldiphosphoundecaprenol N-acetyl-beta-D-mannosaminyltransferase
MAGLPISTFGERGTVDYVVERAEKRLGGLGVHFLTAHTIALSESQLPLREVLTSGDLLVPDSRWLELLSGIRKKSLAQVRGPSFFRQTLKSTEHSDLTHYFIAPTNRVSAALELQIKESFPSLRLAGISVAPFVPMPPDYVSGLSKEILSQGQPIVWVGVGTPAQNFLVHALARESGLVVVGVGAAFEFLTGVKREAPKWFRFLGLEWFFRLVAEPRRLWRRYLFGNPVFLYAVLKHKLMNRR